MIPCFSMSPDRLVTQTRSRDLSSIARLLVLVFVLLRRFAPQPEPEATPVGSAHARMGGSRPRSRNTHRCCFGAVPTARSSCSWPHQTTQGENKPCIERMDCALAVDDSLHKRYTTENRAGMRGLGGNNNRLPLIELFLHRTLQ